MAIIINKEQYDKTLTPCKKSKHKLRENKFGIVFCTRCGLLSTSVGNVEKLQENDKLIIK